LEVTEIQIVVAIVAAIFAIAVVIGGWVWNLSGRLATTDQKAENAAARADVAGINVAANTIRCENMSRLLSDHKESVAKEYVSQSHLVALENRIVDALSRLGDRIDNVFVNLVNQKTAT
jgi:hypothetical protein